MAQSRAATKLFTEGLEEFDLGHFVEALDLFSESISKFNNYAEAYDYRGRCHLILENTEKAINDFERAKTLNPGLIVPLVQLISYYIEEKAFVEAIRNCNLVISYHPENAGAAFFDRAVCQEGLGNKSLAIGDYQKAIENCEADQAELIQQANGRISILSQGSPP